MAKVQTVLGPIDPEEMGVTDYHEHVYVDLPPWIWNIPGYADFGINDVDRSIEELRSWQAAGGRTLVDATAIDFGLEPNKMRQIAEAVPEVNIVATTGFNKSFYCERWVYKWSIDELADFVAEHVTKGIFGTDVKAGVIKGGSMYMRMQEIDEKLIRVAARAHLMTGAPISTHTEGGTMALQQLDILEEEGVDLTRVAIGHSDRNPDPGYHIAICKRGAYVGHDCPGKVKYGPDSWRVALIKEIIGAGYGKQILLGNDLGRVSYLRAYGGGPGWDYVLTRFVPRLRAEGVSKKAIDDILIENPRQFYAF